MQDLSSRVQKIASSFYETRSNRAFTDFYNTLLPEANKMLRNFIKDPQTIEDISSKIFETILTKPSIYLSEQTQQQFIEIAAGFFGLSVDQVELSRIEEVVPSNTRASFDSNDAIDAAQDAKIESNVNMYYAEGKNKKVRVDMYYVPKEGIEANHHKGEKIPYAIMGKMWLLIYGSNCHKAYRVFISDENDCDKEIEVKLTKAKLSTFDLSTLINAVTPFIFSTIKPYLHYFSRIVKTNALSHIKKNKKFQDQHFSDMYSGYDDDDKPQLIANQLSSEPERIEKEHTDHQEQLENQKFMIIFDIIQDTVPENQRGIMIDAILYKMDYKQIAAKYQLDTVGCIKSRVHRFKKLLDEKTAQTPHFTSQVNLGVYKTYFSGGQVRMAVDVCELTDEGVLHSMWHGHYVEYYSTGQVKAIGRYYINKRNGDWYHFHKNGAIMKRGKYQSGKPDGVWHHFDDDGKLNSSINHLTGYYEVHQENGEVVSGIKDSTILPVKEKKPSADETSASRLCIKYDSELAYPSLHFEIQ